MKERSVDSVAARHSLKLLRLFGSLLSVVQLGRPCLYPLLRSYLTMFVPLQIIDPILYRPGILAILIATWWQRCLRTIA